jgi:hypothetical protein
MRKPSEITAKCVTSAARSRLVKAGREVPWLAVACSASFVLSPVSKRPS